MSHYQTSPQMRWWQSSRRCNCRVVGVVFVVRVVSLFTGLLLAGRAIAATYTGSLDYTPPAPAGTADDIFAGGLKWASKHITISWEVTDTDTTHASHPWLYTYTFDVHGAKAPIGHIIIETSPGVGAGDIILNCGANLLSTGLQTVGLNTVGMREDMYGLDFQPLTSDTTYMVWSFYADRPPVWGDFYARASGSGTANYAYNFNNTGGTLSGFLNPDGNTSVRDDVDPTNDPASGNCDYGYFAHILRPDTVIANVPEPGAATLLLAGAVVLLNRARRKLTA